MAVDLKVILSATYMPVAMEPRRLGQESCKLNASLGSRADSV